MHKTISRLVVLGAAASLALGVAAAAASTALAAPGHLAAKSGYMTATHYQAGRVGALDSGVSVANTSCDYTVNANNINIRTSPDGPPSGYKLQKGFYWLSDPLKYSGVVGGQHWVYGENTGIHGWVGGHYLDYSGSTSACKAPL